VKSIARLSRRTSQFARIALIVQVAIAAAVTTSAAWAANIEKQPEPIQEMSALDRINHIIVIYQENHSFDNYLGTFPGVDGIANARATATQTDKRGQVYDLLPAPLANPIDGISKPPSNFPAVLPNGPFLMNEYVKPEDGTANMAHAFYRQQYQINGGQMDRFVAWADAGGLVMGYWDLRGSPLYELAREFTVADRFFMGAFGGSFLNHQWLICACTPVFPNAPAQMTATTLPEEPDHMLDKQVTLDGYVVNHDTANPSFSVNGPRPADAKPELLIPGQTAATIGDRLSDAGVDWAWYSGGWNDAVAGNPDPHFQFHHQPFTYYDNYAAGTTGRATHLRDENDFLATLNEGHLPAVSFVKPIGLDNEHPSYATVARGQQHLAQLVDAVRNSPVWADTLIVITYDDNGGEWDHVAPPVIDRWGPGVRVPTVIISPLARRGYVDHTTYDTTSILRTIEQRWRLAPLGTRDAAANDLTSALERGDGD
jgi:phospholipase C